MPLRGREFGLRLVVIRSGLHPRAGAFPSGRALRQKEVMGELAGFLLSFGCDCVMWGLISGLRVFPDSWVFRVLICAGAAIGFGGVLFVTCHGRYAAECKMITNKQTFSFYWL